MKRLNSKYVWVIATFLLAMGYMNSCTKDDQILDEPVVPVNSATDLVSLKVTSPPGIDGVVDALWNECTPLNFSTEVPEVTGDIFRGYTGNIIPSVTLRSVYDNNNVYFLAQWKDPTESVLRQPWYFDPVTKRWSQELGAPTFTTVGSSTSMTRPAFYEDKLALLFNVNNSVSGWNNGTCYKSCHTGLPAADGSSRHYTNFPTEKIDMWHWKSVRGGANGGFQFDDQYQDNTYPNGRKSDAGASAYADNKQTLVITGSSPALSVSVPKYVIPNRTNYGWILGSEVTDATALLITAVDSNGVLTYNGGTIDAAMDTLYQRAGATVGAKAIPGIVITSYSGSRADVICKSTYSAGTGWTLEFMRALKTTDDINDVDFSSLADQYFGFAIFENSQIAHSIKPNLVLKFKQ